MKKTFLILLSFLCLLDLGSAQTLLRYNYKKNNLIYTGSERVRVLPSASKATPLQLKLSKVLFQDGQPVYLLRVEFEESTAWKMPANAPLTLFTRDGRSLVLKNSGSAPNLVAPEGFVNQEGNKVFLNYGEYYLEEADLQKLLSGVVRLEATKRWSSDGVIRITFKEDEFSNALNRQYDELKTASKPASELGSNLKSLQDQGGSRLAETNTVRVNDGLSVSLVYLYYASSNSESIDLNLYLPGKTIPFTSSVVITTRSGERINLQQEKELPSGRAICYPSLEQLKSISTGVSSISVHTTSNNVVMDFPADEFAKAISKLYNSLMTVAIL